MYTKREKHCYPVSTTSSPLMDQILNAPNVTSFEKNTNKVQHDKKKIRKNQKKEKKRGLEWGKHVTWSTFKEIKQIERDLINSHVNTTLSARCTFVRGRSSNFHRSLCKWWHQHVCNRENVSLMKHKGVCPIACLCSFSFVGVWLCVVCNSFLSCLGWVFWLFVQFILLNS